MEEDNPHKYWGKNIVMCATILFALSGIFFFGYGIYIYFWNVATLSHTTSFISIFSIPLLTFSGYLAIYLGFISQEQQNKEIRKQNEKQSAQIKVQKEQLENQANRFIISSLENTVNSLFRNKAKIQSKFRSYDPYLEESDNGTLVDISSFTKSENKRTFHINFWTYSIVLFMCIQEECISKGLELDETIVSNPDNMNKKIYKIYENDIYNFLDSMELEKIIKLSSQAMVKYLRGCEIIETEPMLRYLRNNKSIIDISGEIQSYGHDTYNKAIPAFFSSIEIGVLALSIITTNDKTTIKSAYDLNWFSGLQERTPTVLKPFVKLLSDRDMEHEIVKTQQKVL